LPPSTGRPSGEDGKRRRLRPRRRTLADVLRRGAPSRAINLTPGWVDERARRRIPDWDTEVVVYCQGEDCDSSVKVAHRLLELGYRNIRHYSGGVDDWRDAGLPLEGGRV
jgi:rhodanese-related sulfurtransferase